MPTLPLAVRVAAGLAVVTVERARKLPQDLAGLPMTAVSQAMQVSMRVQQRITDLAIRGDNVIAMLSPPPERPPWAVFDEDVDDNRDGNGHDGRRWAGDATDEALPTDWYQADYGLDDAGDDPAERPSAGQTEPTEPHAEPQPTEPQSASVPDVLPGYPELSLASLRARLRGLDVADLQVLLDYELASADRPEFVRMLTNRLTRLRQAERAGHGNR